MNELLNLLIYVITSNPKSLNSTTLVLPLQELVTFTQSCKKCLTVIENNHQSVQRILDSSKTLQHLDMALLQKRAADLQASSQVQYHNITLNGLCVTV